MGIELRKDNDDNDEDDNNDDKDNNLKKPMLNLKCAK